jgi:hypothetical protein
MIFTFIYERLPFLAFCHITIIVNTQHESFTVVLRRFDSESSYNSATKIQIAWESSDGI